MEKNDTVAFIYLNRLAVDVSIGVYLHERFMRSVFISITAEIPATLARPQHDSMTEVLNYESLAHAARRAVKKAGDHIQLLETLCQLIADECLTLPSIQAVLIRVDKQQAIEGCESIGVEIYRRKSTTN